MTRPPDSHRSNSHETPMIVVENVSKSYGHTLAVSGLSFEVGAREVVGFLGPNGAGKSTTIRIIAGFLGASQGRVTVDGLDVDEAPLVARERIGYMPENVPLYPELRVGEYLRYRAELKRIGRRNLTDEVHRVMAMAQVDDHEEVVIGELSKGYRQRVGLADALLGSPAVLILDEPTAGMDPNQIREVRELIRSLAGKHAVLLSTHIMSEVEATCDRAIIIDKGRLIAQGTIDKLKTLRRSQEANLTLRGAREKIEQVFSSSDWCRSWRLRVATRSDDAQVFEAHLKWEPDETAETAMERTLASLIEAGIRVQEAMNIEPTLEEVFATLTEQADQVDEDEREEP